MLRGSDHRVNQLVELLISRGNARGVVVVLLQPDGRDELYTFGQRGAEGSPPPTEDTDFEVASVTKVFTALLLADMVVHHEVAVDAPIAPGVPITYEQLATHTSGLPRIPPDMKVTWDDPYASYTEEQLQHLLGGIAQNPPTPGTYSYSNLGYGILGYSLARAAHSSYPALISQRIARPLGLTRTRVGAVPGDDSATGHDDEGKPAPAWTPGVLSGAYAVHSTARDLTALLRAHMLGSDTSLARAIELALEPRVSFPGGHVALGWHVGDATGVYWHNGRSAGFSSFVAFHPRRHFGLVLLVNSGTPLTDGLGLQLLKLLLAG